MNIKQAKDYIKDCVRIYLKKDEFGEYRIPVVRQRPVFLLGAPGIGKTAIMEQIAQELGLALVSYSMTHHTRQSALGLPFICRKEYDGVMTDVSEYTMSEIISSIYGTMESSGIREGILFLDEMNCVSETLAPSMLQFLQYKVFGRHRIPEGWVVVTAGNPPEYNKSVREFDVVTLDRLKVLDVEADYRTWKEYAAERGIHGAILNYLELKKEHFYRIEASVRGKTYVTARGWEDLSEILLLYEEEGLAAEEELVSQYIRNEKIAKEFSAYYDLYNKYKRDYQIYRILSGEAPREARERAKAAPFDERLSLVGMLLDRIQSEMRDVVETADFLTELTGILKAVRALSQKEDAGSLEELIGQQAERLGKQMDALQKAGALSGTERKKKKRVLSFLQSEKKAYMLEDRAEATFERTQVRYGEYVEAMKREMKSVSERLHALFGFLEDVFPEGNEMLIFVTELTVNDYSARFISMFGSEDYQRHNDALLISERRNELQEEIAALEL